VVESFKLCIELAKGDAPMAKLVRAELDCVQKKLKTLTTVLGANKKSNSDTTNYMTCDSYRNKMKLDGSSHVCHIIAASNGGPDHADNFIALSADFNVTIGNAHDDIMAYLAGVVCKRSVSTLITAGFDQAKESGVCGVRGYTPVSMRVTRLKNARAPLPRPCVHGARICLGSSCASRKSSLREC
jgi:hypothetical protein